MVQVAGVATEGGTEQRVHPAQRGSLVIRVAGEAGEGIKKPGELLIQAATRAGFQVLTDFSPPSEIKGGVSFFQIRLSSRALYTRGDSPDVLLCFNQEAYEVNIQELAYGGLLIYDPGAVIPRDEDKERLELLAFPMEQIAAKELKMPIVKNIVALGGLSGLFGLETSHLYQLIDELWARKGAAVVQTNYKALETGVSFVQEHFDPQVRERFLVRAGEPATTNMVVSGNQATALGAIAAGCTFFAGYPITPASDIMEFLAAVLPKIGGAVIQAEDEISAINMIIGAGYAGKRAMTSTSGPGLSLMVEALGLATMAEIPCVIVDAQRAGPSTGMPTRHEQGDLYLCAYGAHGEVPRIVLAATSVEDCFYLAVEAFNLAEKYQSPVILMTDTVVAVRTEGIRRPDLSTLRLEQRLTWEPDGVAPGATNGKTNGTAPASPPAAPYSEGDSGYLRYRLTESGVSPMSIPGTPGGQYVAMGLEHNEKGRHRPDPRSHTQMTDKRFKKFYSAAAEAPEATTYGDPQAPIGIVTWGSTAGVAIEAIDILKEEGVNACMVAPKMLLPLPDQQLGEFMRTKQHIVIPEVNFRGQFANLVMGKYPRQAVRVNVYGGRPMLVDKLVEAIRQVARGEVTDGKIVISPITFPLEELVTPDDLIAPVEQR
ncbi:MAG TPA: 2-oxoacid:acceptor oxidoreductase subunit alpha [Chloroflexota bacterium]|jgi:2-oxoglutarate ferredoxin oxidoreductase subunit alpha|nr:2-oxoacid:acceptor oxidoreductase subunit alpha [Chloroflexota bacterium]